MLVHEACVRVVDVDQPQKWNGRGHFFTRAAEAMRRVALDVAATAIANPIEDLLALNRFEEQWPDKAKLVKLKLFAGPTIPEASEANSPERDSS